MTRLLALLYGVVVYVVFFATFLYLIGFVIDLTLLPKTINEGGPAASLVMAVGVNLALMAAFGLQHSIMARSGFKRVWTRIVPWSVERSTYVLAATLVLILLLWQWRPIPGIVWQVEMQGLAWALWAICFAGWGILLFSTFAINHFDLFGLRQVWLTFRGQPIKPLEFQTPGPYRMVRHPLYFGFLLGFWAVPVMTVGHLLFAAGMTAYILIGVYYEERDLLRHFGNRYQAYRERVPMLIPLPLRKTGTTEESSS